MKTRQPEGQASGEATKHTVCWNKDPQAQALRVELADGSFLVLPYDHLGFVKFEPKKDGDIVHVFVRTHEIEIGGMNLRELGMAFQKCAVDWVRALPARSSPRADDNYVWNQRITVRETQKWGNPDR